MASVALLALAMLLFIAAVVGWFASFKSTEAAVDLPSTSTWRASRADWLALEDRPRVRLVFTAARPEALVRMEVLSLPGRTARGPELRAGNRPGPAALAAALTPMAAVLAVVVSRGVYCVRTSESCPAEMPCNSITGGGVSPSSSPVRVEGNRLIYISPEQTHPSPRGSRSAYSLGQ